jgi:hypothetical protein
MCPMSIGPKASTRALAGGWTPSSRGWSSSSLIRLPPADACDPRTGGSLVSSRAAGRMWRSATGGIRSREKARQSRSGAPTPPAGDAPSLPARHREHRLRPPRTTAGQARDLCAALRPSIAFTAAGTVNSSFAPMNENTHVVPPPEGAHDPAAASPRPTRLFRFDRVRAAATDQTSCAVVKASGLASRSASRSREKRRRWVMPRTVAVRGTWWRSAISPK